MSQTSFWMVVFTRESWQEFLRAGANIYGVQDIYRRKLEETKPGDYLLPYITRLSRFVGTLEVLSTPYYDSSLIWSTGVYPNRIRVKAGTLLPLNKGIPVMDLKDNLSFFKNYGSPKAWGAQFRTSIKPLNSFDAKILIDAVLHADNQNLEGV